MDTIRSFQPSIRSQISHELRIPLTGILGMLHFLDQTPLNAQQRDYLHTILEAAEQLQQAETNIHNLLSEREV